MSKLDELMTAHVKSNLSYLRLAIQPASRYIIDNKEEEEIANFLWQWMKAAHADIDREQRQNAIQNRNNLNNGHTKASH
jgi:hypothetical protein